MLQSDELYSIQRFIGESFSGPFEGKPPIVLKRLTATDTVKRPYFKIENPAGPKALITPTWYQAWVRKLYNDPRYKMLIPLWLFDFPYFPARLYLKDGTSTLAAGSYSVQVVAENDLGQLTRPSAVTTINVATSNNKQIVVQIPREPRGFPIGYRFHVYLSGSMVSPTTAHRVGSILATGKVDPSLTLTSDVPNGTTQGLATALMTGLPAKSEVRFRYMRVVPESVDTSVIEEPEEDGLFNYTVRFQTHTPGMREYPHPQAVGSLQVAVAVTT
jgi:hypothetical protein